MSVSPQYDLAIVGGGIAGLYCCLRAHPDKKVALFEGTHRIGGKIETVSMAGFKAEYGAMRFDPVRQVMVGRLIQELGPGNRALSGVHLSLRNETPDDL